MKKGKSDFVTIPRHEYEDLIEKDNLIFRAVALGVDIEEVIDEAKRNVFGEEE